MNEGAIGYIILIALWYAVLCVFIPAFCFYSRIKTKRLIWRLAFYHVIGIAYINVWGFIFAYGHFWYKATVWIAIIVLPIVLKLILDRKALFGKAAEDIRDYKDGYIGYKRIRRNIFTKIGKIPSFIFDNYIKKHGLQIIFLIALGVFVVWYYGYIKLYMSVYSCSDEPTHLYWINALLFNAAFPAGLYPHSMHFLLGAISTLSGIQTATVVHYFSIVSTLLIHLMLYCALKQYFNSKAACLGAMGFFVLSGMFRTGERFQMTLPMEFGFIALFAMLIFLEEYMHNRDKLNKWMFIAAVFCTFQAHFYVTIFAIFIWAAYTIVYFVRMIKYRYFFKTALAAIIAIAISVLPFVVGYLYGYQFEQSINWALSVMQNEDYYDSDSLSTVIASESEDVEAVEEASEETSETASEETSEEEEDYLTDYQIELSQVSDLNSATAFAEHILTYKVLKSESDAFFIYLLEIFAFVFGIFALIWSKVRKRETIYIIVIPVMLLITYILYIMPLFQLPAILEVGRAAVMLTIMLPFIFAMPIQCVSNICALIPVKKKIYIENVLLVFTAAGLGAFFKFGEIKDLNDLTYAFVVQGASNELNEKLIEENEIHKWTVISPVNDLLGMRCYGYHYEVIDLLMEIENGADELYIPTDDIYVIVEKKIPDTTMGLKTALLGSDMLEYAYDVNEEFRNPDFWTAAHLDENNKGDAYYADKRWVTMSKLYFWMEEIKSTYPAETSVVMEDENCIIYHIDQDPYFLLNLALDYRTESEEEE